MTKTRIPTVLAALATTTTLLLGAPAHASHGNGGNGGNGAVVTTGSCSDGSRWKVKVKPDDGGLEVEGEVDTNRSGQTWHWKIKDNGEVEAKGRATTGGRSGSFSVSRLIADRAGSDSVTFKAKRHGRVCTGRVSV